MSRFPTAAHLVSWAGLCPSARQSGPRTRSGKKGQGDTWLRSALGQAANGAAHTATFPGERYHRIARRRGKPKAQVAVARSILVIIWQLAPAHRPRCPVHRPRPRLLPGPSRHRPQAEEPHPADPGPRLRRHHHQVRVTHTASDQARSPNRPGSAAARPFPAVYFPVSLFSGQFSHGPVAPAPVAPAGRTSRSHQGSSEARQPVAPRSGTGVHIAERAPAPRADSD